MQKSAFFLLIPVIMISNPLSAQKWKAFHLSDIEAKHQELGKLYFPFLDEPTLKMGLYELKAGSEDPQHPHDLDEIYYITKGKAEILIGDRNYEIGPGKVVFVRAEVEHKFHGIKEDLQTLVVFSESPYDPEDPAGEVFDIAELRSSAKENENVWNQFLQVATMRMGAYLLPKPLGGDQELVHEVDEINLVISGSGGFRMDQDQIEIGTGSIVWVKAGVKHQFNSLKENLEVLILIHREK